jgi:hypothetical protein
LPHAATARDAKFTELAADFAAAIRGVPKKDPLSQEVREQRRAEDALASTRGHSRPIAQMPHVQ